MSDDTKQGSYASGQSLSIRVPRDVHRRAKISAAIAGLSLNAYIVQVMDAASISDDALKTLEKGA